MALSATIGYVFSGAMALWPAALIALGVILLSGASSVLNQIQERKEDAQMARTADRPIPAGKITLQKSFIIFSALILTGTLVLLQVNFQAAAIGVFTILLYNGIYTPLKKITTLSIFPGAMVGALPPVIGWVGGGETIADPAIMILAGFMFMWQMPHFLLLAVKYHEQYKNAGFQVALSDSVSGQTRWLLLLWVITTSFAALFFPFFGLVQSPVIVAAIIILNMALILLFFQMAFKAQDQIFKTRLHRYVSLYMVVFLLLIAADSIISTI